MEDVKWFFRKWGILFGGLIILVIVGSIVICNHNKSKNTPEVVWEPSVEITDSEIAASDIEREEEKPSESVLEALVQPSECLITEEEKKELQNLALSAAIQVKEVYQDVEIDDSISYGSNIKNFTREQCKTVVKLLGEKDFVSTTEDTNMENYEKIEEFYSAYQENRESMVAIFDVYQDGLIGTVTFIYREGKIQTYFVGIGWREGGTPVIKDKLVSDVKEIKLTEKGYFIYAYEIVIPHASLRQYWRIKPLSDECRKLTKKYISGLSYVNYNMLVTNWNAENIQDILMPCMFEDIYRIYTGDNLRVEGNQIPADMYEEIMLTYFPVSKEILQKNCEYDANSNTYAYEMIYASPYAPFGEVIDYWNNDDGTFRYISNTIEQKELELPSIAGPKG